MAKPLAAIWPSLVGELVAVPRLLVAMDFDGTLAPLAASPAAAEMPAETRELLRELAALPDVKVAIVTGRQLEDIRGKVRLTELYYIGNHGLEASGPDLHFLEEGTVQAREGVYRLEGDLRSAVMAVPGAILEVKKYSFSVHYRQVEPGPAIQLCDQVAELAKKEPLFACMEGHQVVEIRPQLPADKGTTLLRLADHLQVPRVHVFFAGDDVSDEAGFAVLPDAVTIRIGNDGYETKARWRCDDPAEFAGCLRELLQRRASVVRPT